MTDYMASGEIIDFFSIADSEFGKNVFEESPYDNIVISLVLPKYENRKQMISNAVYLLISCGIFKLYD